MLLLTCSEGPLLCKEVEVTEVTVVIWYCLHVDLLHSRARMLASWKHALDVEFLFILAGHETLWYCVQAGDLDLAQEWKSRLEQRQRAEQALRIAGKSGTAH